MLRLGCHRMHLRHKQAFQFIQLWDFLLFWHRLGHLTELKESDELAKARPLALQLIEPLLMR